VVSGGTAIDHLDDDALPGEQGLGNAGDSVADDER
jgi:hypothetical protein